VFEGASAVAIELYQNNLSKRECPAARFGHDHCSDYGINAIKEYGLLEGSLRILARTASCFRRDVDSYVDKAKSYLDLVKLAHDAYRMSRVINSKGRNKIKLSDTNALFSSENWKNKNISDEELLGAEAWDDWDDEEPGCIESCLLLRDSKKY
jgi:putative component of membrane protein insertase Oxa1/YidC/SpoIIIJ protein YidD